MMVGFQFNLHLLNWLRWLVLFLGSSLRLCLHLFWINNRQEHDVADIRHARAWEVNGCASTRLSPDTAKSQDCAQVPNVRCTLGMYIAIGCATCIQLSTINSHTRQVYNYQMYSLHTKHAPICRACNMHVGRAHNMHTNVVYGTPINLWHTRLPKVLSSVSQVHAHALWIFGTSMSKTLKSNFHLVCKRGDG